MRVDLVVQYVKNLLNLFNAKHILQVQNGHWVSIINLGVETTIEGADIRFFIC